MRLLVTSMGVLVTSAVVILMSTGVLVTSTAESVRCSPLLLAAGNGVHVDEARRGATTPQCIYELLLVLCVRCTPVKDRLSALVIGVLTTCVYDILMCVAL